MTMKIVICNFLQNYLYILFTEYWGCVWANVCRGKPSNLRINGGNSLNSVIRGNRKPANKAVTGFKF